MAKGVTATMAATAVAAKAFETGVLKRHAPFLTGVRMTIGVLVENREGHRARVRAAEAADRDAASALLSAARLPLPGLDETRLWVLELDGTVVGVIGYESYGEHALLRSLAVHTEHQGQGLARALLTHLFAELREAGATSAYALTATVPTWLLRLGFVRVPREALPQALQGSKQFQGACPASTDVFHKVLS